MTKVGDELWAGYSGGTVLSPQVCLGERSRVATDGTLLDQAPDVVSAAASTDDVAVRFSTSGGCDTATYLTAYDVATAQPLWIADPQGLVSHSLPTVVGDTAYIAAGTALRAYALAGCGQPECSPAWSVDLGVAVRQPVGGHDGQVFVTTAGPGAADLVALSAADGTELWRAPLAASAARAAVTEGAVYVGAGTSLQVYDAAGCGAASCAPLWTASLTSGSSAPPVVAGDVAYVGDGATVVAFDARGCGAPTCTPLVSLPLPHALRSMSVAQGQLLAVSTVTTGSPPFTSTTSAITAFAPTS